jgi:predicted deacylase
MNRTLSIDNQSVKYGDKAVINLNIARLISGTEIDLPIYAYRSKKPGPTVLLSGGLHGDEINGVEIVRRMIDQKVFDNLKCGSVIAIPVMNIYGFLNFSREVPDGKDINRSFPGSLSGSLASRVAYNLTHKVLQEIDFGLDFHTGGANRYNYPQTRFDPSDARAKEISEVFNAPISLESKFIDKSFRKQAMKMDKTIVVYEAGESMRFDEQSITEGILGAKKVLAHFGMIDFTSEPQETIKCSESIWVRAKGSGILHLEKTSGQSVKSKEILATITDPFGNFKTKIKAPKDGTIIGHTNAPLVNQGDALYHIGN